MKIFLELLSARYNLRLRTSFMCDRRARSAYNVPIMLDASDQKCMRQETLVLTYLSELRASLPQSSNLGPHVPGASVSPLGKMWPSQQSRDVQKIVASAPRPPCPSLRSWPPQPKEVDSDVSDASTFVPGEYTESPSSNCSVSETSLQEETSQIATEETSTLQNSKSSPLMRSRKEFYGNKDGVIGCEFARCASQESDGMPRLVKAATPAVKRGRLLKCRPTHVVFEGVAATLYENARVTIRALCSTTEDVSQLRQLFAECVCSIATPIKLEKLWEAREKGSKMFLNDQLRDLGIEDTKDRKVLSEFLADPYALGESPEPHTGKSPSSASILDALRTAIGLTPREAKHENDAKLIAQRLTLPFARKGLGIYAKRIGKWAALLWRTRECGAFKGLEGALRNTDIFGETDVTIRTVLAGMLLKPAVLPYYTNMIDELIARGAGAIAPFACQNELALCAARDFGGRAAIIRAARNLMSRRGASKHSLPKIPGLHDAVFRNAPSQSMISEDGRILALLAAVIGDKRRFPSWRSRFDQRAARPPLLRTRAAMVWLRAKARCGSALVRHSLSQRRDGRAPEEGGYRHYQRRRTIHETARALQATLASLDLPGTKAGDYDDCLHAHGSRVQARHKSFSIAYEKYGVAPLDPMDVSISTLFGDDKLLGLYICDLAKRAAVSRTTQLVWNRLAEDDRTRDELDYSLALADFVRLHLEQMTSDDSFDDALFDEIFASYDIVSTLCKGGGLLLLLKALDAFSHVSDQKHLDLDDANVSCECKKAEVDIINTGRGASGLRCPQPTGDAETDLNAAVEYAHLVWGTPRTFLNSTRRDETVGDDGFVQHKALVANEVEESSTVEGKFAVKRVETSLSTLRERSNYQKPCNKGDLDQPRGADPVSNEAVASSMRPTRERLEAFLTELLIRLPDEAFDDIHQPSIYNNANQATNFYDKLDIFTTQYQGWHDYVKSLPAVVPEWLASAQRELEQAEGLAVSEYVALFRLLPTTSHCVSLAGLLSNSWLLATSS